MKKISIKLVLIISSALSVLALYFSFQNNYILTYNDAASHLNISRRVIDNLTPGFAQIGTVWLPLPHVLMIPFAWNDFLWHTGLAGSVVSMAAYILSILLIYKIIFIITENSIGATIGSLIMALNPNLLYLQTTPMTEPLLLATLLLSIYFVARYIKTHAINNLILAGGSIALSTLVRYDGWFLFISLSVLIPIWVYKLFGKKEAESSFFLFIFSGGFGIFLWVLWNLTIFGDPLYFITGPYSAYAQQRVLKEVGQLPTEGSIITSLIYYFWAMVENNGIFLIFSMFIGVILAPILLSRRVKINSIN